MKTWMLVLDRLIFWGILRLRLRRVWASAGKRETIICIS